MYKKLFIIGLLLVLGLSFWQLTDGFNLEGELSQTARNYAEQGPAEVGSQNLVTAVVVTYRGFDTLGEVTILFVAAAIIGLFLKTTGKSNPNRKIRPSSEILKTAQKILLPLIFMFGAYVFINGHLSPGGGFQGGAIIASGIVLLVLTNPYIHFNHAVLATIESISGFAFVVIGVLGIFFASGFFDNSILPLGDFGSLFSAGAIPIIYIFLGLKVGTELTNVLISMQEIQNEK